jgi:murein L,D-transpeptidase YafK
MSMATRQALAVALTLSASSALASPETVASAGEHPEQRLRAAIAAMQAGELSSALEGLDALVRDEPTFRVAQLYHGQLLAARSGRWQEMQLSSGEEIELTQLLDEARLRLNSHLPGPDELPLAVMRLPETVSHAIAVDLQAARLYLLENNGNGLTVRKSMYASMGREGYGKEVEGDNRTPLGVYRVTSWLDGGRLPDLYGSGAFPVDYPNDWDRKLRRTGFGIWLHGVPSNSYTRPPRSSEGCVTVANADLIALRDYVVPGQTPVIFADRLEWASRDESQRELSQFESVLERWRKDWASLDTDAYMSHYAENFRTDSMDRESFAAHKRRVNSNKQWVSLELKNLAIYRYPGETDLMQVQFTQDYRSDNFNSRAEKLQYWRLQPDGNWQIIREVSS